MSLTHPFRPAIPILVLAALLPDATVAQEAIVEESVSEFDYGDDFGGYDNNRSWGRDWQFFAGAGYGRSPEYEGSDIFESSPFFGFEAVWRDRLTISPDGIGAFLLNGEPFSLYMGLEYGGGRDESDSVNLKGLGRIDSGLAVSLGAQYDLGFGAATVDVTKFTKGSEGTLVTLGLQSDVPFGVLSGTLLRTGTNIPDVQNERDFVLTGGISLTWADSRYNQAFYGVTSAQSASSGLKQFNAGAGPAIGNVTFGVTKPLGPNWGITGEVTYSKLFGDAADSPITKRDDFLSYSLGVGFNF